MNLDFDEYLGVVARSHGIDGTMVLSDVVYLPRPLDAGTVVGIGYSREFLKPYTVEEFSQTPLRTLLRVREIRSSENVQEVADQAVYIVAEHAGVAVEGRYRLDDVEGCVAVTESGEELGVITEVWLLPANDVWVVQRANGTTIPLPVIDPVIKNVDLNKRIITVTLLPGLADIDSTSNDERDD